MRGRTLATTGTLVGLLLLTLPVAAAATTGDSATVTGTVFLDLDGDGTRGDDEPGRADVPIALRTSAAVVDATTTGVDGTWTLSGVQPGNYELVVEPPVDHAVTGGTANGLDDAGTATLEVTGDLDAGTVGLGSPVTSGADVVATAVLDEEASGPTSFRWLVAAHNLGPEDAEGPVDLRLVLSSGHEANQVEADGWDGCEVSAAIVLCEVEADIPAGTSLPDVALTTTAVGDVGATVSVTATARLDGAFDEAPLNDEASATGSIGGDGATEDLDGDGDGDLTDAGATTTGMLVAGLLAVVLGAAALGATRRDARRP